MSDGVSEAGRRVAAIVEIFEEPSVFPSDFNSDALSVLAAAHSRLLPVRARTYATQRIHTLSLTGHYPPFCSRCELTHIPLGRHLE